MSGETLCKTKKSLRKRVGLKSFVFFIADKNGNVPEIVSREQTERRPAKRGCCQRCLISCSVITLAVMLAIAGSVTLYQNYSPFEVHVNKIVGDYTYPVLRTWRHIVLPLHRYFDVQSYSMAECLVNNPWFIPGKYLGSVVRRFGLTLG